MPFHYFTRASLNGLVPPQFVLEALDDDKDGVEDAGIYDLVVANAQEQVEGILGKRFAVPFSNPVPQIVTTATRIIVAEMLYKRRGYSGENNPFESQANKERAALEKIASGTDPLTPEIKRQKPSASAITEPARTTSATGRTAV